MNQEQEERAFLEDIIANPDDDVPRLVYADWLDDHCAKGQPGWPHAMDKEGKPYGSARADFIRAQVALASGVENAGAPLTVQRRFQLAQRAEDYLDEYQAKE